MAEPTVVGIEEIKMILGIKNTKHDEYLTIMIPILFDHVIAFCNNDFVSNTGLAEVPGGVKLWIAKACEHNMQNAGLKGRSMGSVSYSYELEFPSSIMSYLRPYKRLRFHAL